MLSCNPKLKVVNTINTVYNKTINKNVAMQTGYAVMRPTQFEKLNNWMLQQLNNTYTG